MVWAGPDERWSSRKINLECWGATWMGLSGAFPGRAGLVQRVRLPGKEDD